MKILSTIACGLLAASIATVPASAAVIGFGGGNSALDGTDGNIRSFNVGAINVRASAFSFEGSTLTTAARTTAWLGQYGTSGLGVTNQTEGDGNSDNSHTLDNNGKWDLILLVFDRSVNISQAVLNPFTTANSTDNDAWVSYANLAGAYTTNPTAVPLNSPVWATLIANGKNVVGNMASGHLTNFNTGGNSGNVWAISAARFQSIYGATDGTIDSIKLGAITVQQTGVPEPTTWAMMIVGFGTVGATMRRRRRVAAGITAAA